MHKTYIAAGLFASSLAVGSAPAVAGNDGVIEISGNIVATTCLVEGQPPGGGGASKAVALGDISAGVLANAGDIAGDRGFTIRIGGDADTNCTDGVTAKVRFDPASPLLDRSTGRLNVDPGANAATGVQIQMANTDGSPINMYTQDSQGVIVAGHTAEIPLIARYYSLGNVTGGAANSRVGFPVVYQ